MRVGCPRRPRRPCSLVRPFLRKRKNGAPRCASGLNRYRAQMRLSRYRRESRGRSRRRLRPLPPYPRGRWSAAPHTTPPGAFNAQAKAVNTTFCARSNHTWRRGRQPQRSAILHTVLLFCVAPECQCVKGKINAQARP